MRVLYTAKKLCLPYSCNHTRPPRHSQHQASTQGAPAAGPHRSQGQKSKDGAKTEIQRHLQMFRKHNKPRVVPNNMQGPKNKM